MNGSALYDETTRARLANCRECPRECGVDRTTGELGYCRTDNALNVASVCLHHGEEPVISGDTGICNIFFGHCNLQCQYCQNYQISRNDQPPASVFLTVEDTLDQVTNLLRQGIPRVGFVSPSHVLPQMEAFMQTLADQGHHPVYVFNSNAYDKTDRLVALENKINVFLPDLKYADGTLAEKYSDAPDYPEIARQALREMYRQKGADLVYDETGRLQSGLLIRHLVLPGQVENSLACLRFIAQELSTQVHISLMAQYAPTPSVSQHTELGRSLKPEEYETVVAELHRLGLENGWVQELGSAHHFQPDFSQPHPFSQ